MPVKVRCAECEKVLSAPDRARGKAIKCPGCGSAVRVPIAKPTKKVAAPPPSSSMMIANINLDHIEDTETRICPKCGVEVSAEDIECPECRVNLETGLLSERNKAELSRKGPNPKLYYKEFLKDGIEFWKTEKRLSFRMTTLFTLFTFDFVCCAFMSVYCVKPLLRVFWVFLGVINVLIPPGLAWNLHTTIIDVTMRKKKKVGKYTFDKFLGAALGLKLIFWFLEIAAPLHLAALGFLLFGVRGTPLGFIVAAGLEGAAIVFATLLFPVAMVHMSMPVTTRGWLINKLSKPFFRTIPAVAYWCFFFYLTLLIPVAVVGVSGYYSAHGIGELIVNAGINTQIFNAKAEIANIPKNKEVPEELQKWGKLNPRPMNYRPLFLPSCLLVAAAAFFGMTSIFSMRTNGIYGRYFMDSLDLETMAPEVVYVAKAKNLGEADAEAAKLSWQPVLMGLGLAYAAGILLGGSIGMSYLTGLPEGATYGMLLSGGGVTLVGLVWLAIAASTKSKREQLKFATGALGSGVVVAGIGAILFATMTFTSAREIPTAPEKGHAAAAPGK